MLQTPETIRYLRGPLIGAGGMARVVAATDERLGREVAIKEVGATGASAARLVREARIAAQLEHPGIVPVYDAGVDEDGRVWYAMRLVRGRTFADALAAQPTLAGRLTLLRAFLQACEAVAFAHDAGIVHRDLKPANVLIGEHGETQVADWGVARPTAEAEAAGAWDEVLPDGANATVAGAVVGTPAYMSPEQASARAPDPRDDVYGLGAMLYELLTGRPPFTGTAAEVLEAVRRDAITPVRRLAPEAPPELAAVAERALARDAAARYPTARQLAADVAHFVDGRMVAAYDYTPLDHLRRFLRARRAPLLVAAAALCALVALGVVAWEGTRSERDRAVAAEGVARASLTLADRNLARALEQQAQAALDQDAHAEAEVLAAHVLRLGDSPLARGVLAAFDAERRPRVVGRGPLPACARVRYSADGGRMLCLDDDHVALWSVDPPARRWAVPARARDAVLLEGADRVVVTLPVLRFRLLDAATGATIGEDRQATDETGLQASPGGHVALLLTIGHLMTYDARTGAQHEWRPCPESLNALAGALAPDERSVAVFCSDGSVRFAAPDGGETRALATAFAPERLVIAAAFLPGGRHLVVGDELGDVALVDTATGATVRSAPAHSGRIVAVVPSPGGERVAVVGDRGGVRVWRPATGAWEARLPGSAGRDARFAGDRVVTLGADRRVWALPEGASPRRFAVEPGLAAAELSPDGRLLAAAGGDGTVPVWSTRDGALVASLRWQDGVVKTVAFSPDGRRLAAAGMRDRTVRVFDTATWRAEPPWVGHTFAFRRVGWLAGDLPYGLGYSEGPQVWPGGGPDALVLSSGEPFHDAGARHDGAAVAVIDREGRVMRIVAGDPPRLEPVLEDPRAFAVDLGARLLALARPHEIVLRALDGGPSRTVPHPASRALDVALSPDEDFVAVAGLDGATRLFTTADGVLRAVLRGHTDRVAHVAFSADGATLVSASWDGSARLWDLRGLHTPAAVLVPALEAAWGLGLDDAVGARDIAN